MAVDATGTPTSPDSIPTYATSADAPSGKGFNAAMAAIQTALSARVLKSIVTTAGDLLYATGASTLARLGVGSNGQVLTVSGGLPVWATPAGGATANATTVAGLGTGTDGKLGKLNLAGGEVLPLIYDATKAKWVSPERTSSSSTSYLGAGLSVTAGNGTFAASIWDKGFAAKVAAGLTPEIRTVGYWASSLTTANGLEYIVRSRHITNGTASWTEYWTSSTVLATAAAASSAQGVDTGWLTVTNPGSPLDSIGLVFHFLNNTASSATLLWDLTMYLRWVG